MKISKTILAATLAFTSLVTACGKGKASCDDVVAHTVGLMPAEMKAAMGDKAPMVEKCTKEMSDAQRACVMSASSVEALMKCK